MMDKELEMMWDNMVEFGIATNEELGLAVALMGCNIETFKKVMFIRTGYRSWKQFEECELGGGRITPTPTP